MGKGMWAALLLLFAQVAAADGVEPGLQLKPEMLTEHFLASHPDLRWQREGMHSMDQGRHAAAMNQFKRAARYADKLSQAQIANMYWEGIGVERDRALAYAWMDVAAERLYPDLIVFRERFWNALEPHEREEAIERGQAVLAEYGDEAAKPRMERILNRARRSITGSRLGGSVPSVRVIPLTGPGRYRHSGEIDLTSGVGTVSGEEVYADRYWRPERYWELQDTLWNAPGTQGRVEVGKPAAMDEPGGESIMEKEF